jgi:hypothetical protein
MALLGLAFAFLLLKRRPDTRGDQPVVAKS